MDGDERRRFLQDACGSDEELRREVESLLHHDRTETILPQHRPPDGAAPASGSFWQRQGRLLDAVEGAMTALARKLLATRLRRLISVLLLLAVMGGVGLWSFTRMRESLENSVRSDLRALLDAETAALTLWIDEKKIDVQTWAEHPQIVEQARALASLEEGRVPTPERLADSPDLTAFRRTLRRHNERRDYVEYVLVDGEGRIVAAADDDHLGNRLNAAGRQVVSPVFRGRSLVTKPYREGSLTAAPNDLLGGPIVWALAPVTDQDGQVLAALGFGMPADRGFTSVLSVGRMGESGESFAFDADGMMLSETRFTQQLRDLGLIPNHPDSRAVLAVRLVDPGRTLSADARSQEQPTDAEFTALVRAAVDSRGDSEATTQGEILAPYRDYRGVDVVGAWTWLPEYDFGVATEIAAEEAFAPLRTPVIAFWIRFGVAAAAFAALLAAAVRLVFLRQELGVVRQLGKYALLRKIGEGGMGVVYLARHVLLKRPTAVKLLRPEVMSADAERRFEREVRLASGLTHPNTVEIYDFGRTDDGLLYFSMEYVPGVTIQQLVQLDGPVPSGRTVAILKQVCGSLREAHSLGLVHRDVKPSNLILSNLGRVADTVKVVDFGLAKPIEAGEDMAITSPSLIPGTPLYIAPERLQDPTAVDVRSDVYSLGAVAYFLVTGREVFEGRSRLEVVHQTLTAQPAPPSDLIETVIPTELERLILDCLAKDPDDRPQDVAELAGRLESVAVSDWSEDQSAAWWRQHAERLDVVDEESPSADDSTRSDDTTSQQT